MLHLSAETMGALAAEDSNSQGYGGMAGTKHA